MHLLWKAERTKRIIFKGDMVVLTEHKPFCIQSMDILFICNFRPHPFFFERQNQYELPDLELVIKLN